MGQLTVREKEHWKERIEAKVDLAIEEHIAKNDPTYMNQIEERAKQDAMKVLGIAELQSRLDALSKQLKEIEREKAEVEAEMVTIVRGNSVTQDFSYYTSRNLLDEAIRRTERRIQRELMAQDALGQQILALEAEKEASLDTIWLATSSKQIRLLWTDMLELLKQSPTQLQQKALAVEPESEEA